MDLSRKLMKRHELTVKILERKRLAVSSKPLAISYRLGFRRRFRSSVLSFLSFGRAVGLTLNGPLFSFSRSVSQSVSPRRGHRPGELADSIVGIMIPVASVDRKLDGAGWEKSLLDESLEESSGISSTII